MHRFARTLVAVATAATVGLAGTTAASAQSSMQPIPGSNLISPANGSPVPSPLDGSLGSAQSLQDAGYLDEVLAGTAATIAVAALGVGAWRWAEREGAVPDISALFYF